MYLFLISSWVLHCVCVCVCVCVSVWCSGCVLGSGQLFHLVFHLPPTSPTSPPSCDWVTGICWCVNSRPFLMKQQWSKWDLGAHTTCCEERPILLRVPSLAPGALLVAHSVHSARCMWPLSLRFQLTSPCDQCTHLDDGLGWVHRNMDWIHPLYYQEGFILRSGVIDTESCELWSCFETLTIKQRLLQWTPSDIQAGSKVILHCISSELTLV